MSKSIPLGLAFIVGAACGALVLSSLGTKSSERKATPAFEPSSPAPLDEEPIDLGTPVLPAAPIAADEKTEEDRDTLRARAIGSIEVPLPDDLSGTITGTVVSTDGSPIADAKIEAHPNFPEGSPFVPAQARSSDLEGRVRRLVQRERLGEATKSEATTDSSGSFSLARIGSTEYRVSVKRAGFQFEESRRNAHAGESVEFVGDPRAVAFVEIRTSDGSSPRNVYFMTKTERSNSSRSWSEEEPRVTVEPGRCEVSARAGKLYSETVAAEFRLGEETSITLTLRKQPELTGKLIYPPGEVPGHDLFLGLLVRTDYPEPVQEHLEHAQSSRSGGDTYSFPNLTPGPYWVCIGRGSWWRNVMNPVFLSVDIDGPVELDLEVPPLDLSHGFQVSVFDANGTKVSMPSIQIDTEFTGGGNYSAGVNLIKMRDGSTYALPNKDQLEQFIEKGGSIVVRATASDGSAGASSAMTSFGGAVRIDLSESAAVTVQVVGIPSEMKGVSVRLDSEVGRNRGNRQSLDSNGRVVLSRVSTGPCTVQLYASIEGMGNREILSESATVTAGDCFLTFDFPELYSVTVLDPEEVEVRRFVLQGSSNYRAKTVEGVANFTFVPPGEYRLSVRGSGEQGEQLIVVPTAGPITFEPVAPNALTVVIRDENGAFARAGLREGDIVLSVGGEMASGEDQLRMLGILLQNQQTVELTIVRDEVEMKLEVESAILIETNPGGSLRPIVY